MEAVVRPAAKTHSLSDLGKVVSQAPAGDCSTVLGCRSEIVI